MRLIDGEEPSDELLGSVDWDRLLQQEAEYFPFLR
jgi:hypothetical protein